jgi:hypothetical protein
MGIKMSFFIKLRGAQWRWILNSQEFSNVPPRSSRVGCATGEEEEDPEMDHTGCHPRISKFTPLEVVECGDINGPFPLCGSSPTRTRQVDGPANMGYGPCRQNLQGVRPVQPATPLTPKH